MSNPLPSPEVERYDSQPDNGPGIVNWPLPESVPAASRGCRLFQRGNARRSSSRAKFNSKVPGLLRVPCTTSARTAGLERYGRNAAHAVLIGGVPFGESVIIWWNFVARTADEIHEARDDREAHRHFGDAGTHKGERLRAPPFVIRPIASR